MNKSSDEGVKIIELYVTQMHFRFLGMLLKEGLFSWGSNFFAYKDVKHKVLF